MYAVIKTGGKQYKVQVGETIDVEKLAVEDGTQVRLDQVLLAANGGSIALGRPVIDGAVVTARVVRRHKGPKLIVFKYKSKSRYRRRTGHRQHLTQLSIQSIEVPGWEPARVAVPSVMNAEPVAPAPSVVEAPTEPAAPSAAVGASAVLQPSPAGEELTAPVSRPVSEESAAAPSLVDASMAAPSLADQAPEQESDAGASEESQPESTDQAGA